MSTSTLRAGWPDAVWLAGMVVVAGGVALCVSAGWFMAIVPGVTYLLAGTAALAIYRIGSSRREALGLPASFRVVDAKGSCLLGHQRGDRVSIGVNGSVTPHLCPQAEAMLRLASMPSDGQVREWCCPVYDHLLVFEREAVAA